MPSSDLSHFNFNNMYLANIILPYLCISFIEKKKSTLSSAFNYSTFNLISLPIIPPRAFNTKPCASAGTSKMIFPV
ncbi:hypothetical protein EGX95_01450 (plasmid) [Bacillus sp. FDAARGOS_527]|nr:hypothetical protein EGX95_01450 [Bacillus sp. FDAARGOS_527]